MARKPRSRCAHHNQERTVASFQVSFIGSRLQNPAKEINIGGIEALNRPYDAEANRESPMPAGGFWRIDENSLEKARQWQEKYGDTVAWNDPILYGRDWYYDGANKSATVSMTASGRCTRVGLLP